MNANFASRVTNFEFAKAVRESGFSFKSYKEKIDLGRIAHLDLDRVARDLDISVLQEHVGTIVNCDLGDLKGIDPGLVKLLHLAQLCLDYCLYCQDFLSTSLNSLENVHVETLKELELCKKDNKNLKEKLKKENRKKKHLNEQKENLPASYFECSQCRKGYSSQEYLESHIQRRHSTDLGSFDPSREFIQEVKKEIEALKEAFFKEKESADASRTENQEIRMKREEAMWAEIEKSQAEQRARHQAEIADLTANFQVQLKQSLADLASNLSSASIFENVRASEQESFALKSADRQNMMTEVSEMWRTKFEEQENLFRKENNRLVEQLEKMQEKEEMRWNQLQQLQLAPKLAQLPENPAAMSPEPPVPAIRRRRNQRPQAPPPIEPKFEFREPPPVIEQAQSVEDFVESTDESAALEKLPRTSQSFVMCAPKVIPSRPKSAMGSKTAVVSSDSVSEGEETSEKSDDIDATIKDMKDAIQNNPDLMHSLRQEVEDSVQEKMTEIGLGLEERLSKGELNSVNDHLAKQRKSAEKHHPSFWKLRKSLEKKLDKNAKESKDGTFAEPNIKPSKLKQHSGFFSKLTKHYGKKEKDKRSKSETQIFTSTPMKQSDDSTHSILKPNRDNIVTSSQEALAEQSSGRELVRAQSLPSNKFVSFVTTQDDDKENSWDDSTSKITESEAKESKSLSLKDKNPFVISTATSAKESVPRKFNINDLERELADIQSANTATSMKKKTKSDLSLNLSEENSWDLEDI